MREPKPVLENKTHEILRDFEIQIDPIIPTWKPYVVLINKT